jgi:hypothetical protein
MVDEHCAWPSAGLLDDLFGISTVDARKRVLPPSGARGAVATTSEGKSWRLQEAELQGLEALEKDVRAAAGTALLTTGEVELAVVRRVGAGWAIYLNTLLDGYSKVRGKAQGGAYRGLVKQLLTRLEVQPRVKITNSDGGAAEEVTVRHYRFGESEVVAVLNSRLQGESRFGADGVVSYAGAKAGEKALRRLTVDLPGAAYVTDVRTGRLLGRMARVAASIAAGDALILALHDDKPSLSIKGPRRVKPGEHPAFTITMSEPGRRLVRCRFFDPDGRFLPQYAQNVMFDGAAGQVVMPSAFNDPAGTYRLTTTEILTGAKAETSFRLGQ